MQILVTGGAGYLGSTLVPELLAANHEVTIADNFMYGQTSLNHICNHPKLTILNQDVRRKDVMTNLMKNADAIIPLAAFVGAPLCSKDPFGATAINHDAMMMMLSKKSRDQWVLMPTTNSAYGTGDDNNFCTEESSLNPISDYAIEKVRVEEALMNLDNVISYRLATVFGMSPRMRLDLLVNDFAYRAITDGFIVLFEAHFKRNYIHVRDVAGAFVHGLQNFAIMKDEIFNVGLSSANLSKKELCDKIKKQVPDVAIIEENIRKDIDQRNYIVSNEKLEQTGWKPQYSIDDGIRELIKGFSYLRKVGHSNV
ncbi:NAD(P)-dependent oxidoreductase [Litorivicinus sp.]|nr:NAD(P)-dependent oxidoreductase [Litorivicinus sp.]